jgi:hypothetical protein
MAEQSADRTRGTVVRLLLVLGGTIAGLLFAESICRIVVEDADHSPATLWGSTLLPKDPEDLRVAARSEATGRYMRMDQRLGWTNRSEAKTFNVVHYESDAAGMRILPGWEPARRAGSDVRIAAFGDSFTHCNEVSFEDCWTHLIEVETGARVLNGGVGGYGTDQAFLRYLEMQKDLDADIVVLGLMIGDIKRNVNIFRTFVAGWTAWSKPRFILAGDGIRVINQPTATPEQVPDMIANDDPLLQQDWWYDPEEWRRDPLSWSVIYRFARARLWQLPKRVSYYRHDSEPTLVTARLVIEFARQAKASGSRFICLIIPGQPHLRYTDPVPWQPLLDRMTKADVEIVDPTSELRQLVDTPNLFAPRGHYARPGNQVLASAIVSAIAPNQSAARLPPTP